MKFSVVTISFNQAAFLERTIRSVIDQRADGVSVEYIVVDPGSTDGSREIIARYQNQIDHAVLEPDSGAADGLNKGFALATGDVLAYLNSDDTFEPGAIATVAGYLSDHPNVDVVCGHGWVTDASDRRLRRLWSDPFHPKAVAYGMAVQVQPSTYIRRSAFARTRGFNTANRTNWDGELLLDLHLSGARIAVLNSFLSTYRLHETSITNSGSTKARMQGWTDHRFQALMGRGMTRYDALMKRYWWIRRQLRNPVSFLERLTRGPVFERGA